ncbi:MAG: glycoside hydrolase family 15 protein [Pyrinomonadaceae bacterium]
MRDIPVGNGSLLVNFDDKYQIRDIYFPHVGQENHTEGFPFRFGVWIDGEFSWVYENEWQRTLKYLPDTLVTDVTLRNETLGIEINCNDAVAGRENIYIRRIEVRNLFDRALNVRIFVHQDFRIYENKVGDTAFYDPETRSLIHYKKHRYFLINTEPHFDEFATGRKAFRNSEGTWRDAEDGHLHGGAITEGSVDSTIGVHFSLEPQGKYDLHYWIAAGTTYYQVERAARHLRENGPQYYVDRSIERGRAWLAKHRSDLHDLDAQIVDLYKRSLLIVNSQIDKGGAIIAANDHDVTERATDHYSYLWPRDGAFVANALDLAGYQHLSSMFFALCQKIVHERGYFLQKYNPDGSVGSGWHASWDKYRGVPLVPIQEDETALVLWALWEHYDKFRDKGLIDGLYIYLIKKCADFMVEFRDPETKLPKPSWNLWEDRLGVHTFTCSTVVAGLRAAANFAKLYDEPEKAREYDQAANEMVDAMREHLYSEQIGRFVRSLHSNGDESLTPDETVDASLFGIFYFGCFDIDDSMVSGTMTAVESRLTNRGSVGGVARFENDGYMRESEGIIGNSWFMCTLWLAEYHIAKAKSSNDLQPAVDIINWVAAHAFPSGVLGEQIDPVTGKHLSVSPLTWSHSTFVATVNSYLSKLAAFGQ